MLLAMMLAAGPAQAQPRGGQQLSIPPLSLPPSPVLDVPLPTAPDRAPFQGPASLAPASDAPSPTPAAAPARPVRTRQVT
ncbi:MAG: hypothetical protein V4653_09415, partial [Pseudomonadota bacterium]